MSQADLARRLGISQPSVADALSGKTSVGLSRVEEIAEAIGVSAADLLHSDEPPKPQIVRQSVSDQLRDEILALAREAAQEAARAALAAPGAHGSAPVDLARGRALAAILAALDAASTDELEMLAVSIHATLDSLRADPSPKEDDEDPGNVG